MLKPRALSPGDRLAIVSPASPFNRDEFDLGVEEIRRLGFIPVFDDTDAKAYWDKDNPWNSVQVAGSGTRIEVANTSVLGDTMMVKVSFD